MVSSTAVMDSETGLLYFGSKDMNVYALDSRTGELAWKFKTFDEIISEPVIWKNKLVIGSYDHNLYCLDKGTGRLQWKFATQAEIHNSNAFAMKDGVVYFSCFDDFLRAVDIETGRLLWKARLGQYGCCAAPVIHGEMVLATSRNGIMYAFGTDGKPLWKYATTDNAGIPKVHDGRIYVGSCDYSVYCIGLDGKGLWKFKTNGYVWWEPAVCGDNLIFGSWDCFVYCISLSTRKLLWKFRTSGSPSYIPPANEAFEMELKIPESQAEEQSGKTYQLDFTEDGEKHGAFYKSRITYQVSTHYREKGKYQTVEDDS
jgi:outer membrane protein assembly factor BamB